MTLRRICAGAAAILTVLLVQATIIAPATFSVAVSLPLVLAVSLGLVGGAPMGISMGFAVGLIADLGSNHPVGIFALTWMLAAILCAKVSPILRSVFSRAIAVAAASAAATTAAAVLLTMTGSAGATLVGAVEDGIPVFVGDFVLALLVLPLVARVGQLDVVRGSALVSGDANEDVAARRVRAEIAGLAGQWR